MYAVIEVGGMQWKVSKEEIIRVPKIDEEPGKSIILDNVLLLVDKDDVNIGKPLVSNIKVEAKVISHGRSKKIKVFKKKRRKGYKVLKGHRQEYTELRIDRIGVKKDSKEKTANVVKDKIETSEKSKEKKIAKPSKTIKKNKGASGKGDVKKVKSSSE
jgi:large subunit ribosomal protein L21